MLPFPGRTARNFGRVVMSASRSRIRVVFPAVHGILAVVSQYYFPVSLPPKPSENRTCSFQASDSQSVICLPSVFGLLSILSSSPLVLMIELRTSGSHGYLRDVIMNAKGSSTLGLSTSLAIGRDSKRGPQACTHLGPDFLREWANFLVPFLAQKN